MTRPEDWIPIVAEVDPFSNTTAMVFVHNGVVIFERSKPVGNGRDYRREFSAGLDPEGRRFGSEEEARRHG